MPIYTKVSTHSFIITQNCGKPPNNSLQQATGHAPKPNPTQPNTTQPIAGTSFLPIHAELLDHESALEQSRPEFQTKTDKVVQLQVRI